MGFANDVIPAWLLGRRYKVGDKAYLTNSREIYGELVRVLVQGLRPQGYIVSPLSDVGHEFYIQEEGLAKRW